MWRESEAATRTATDGLLIRFVRNRSARCLRRRRRSWNWRRRRRRRRWWWWRGFRV